MLRGATPNILPRSKHRRGWCPQISRFVQIFRLCFVFCKATPERILPYHYFNQLLVLYTGFPASKQNRIVEIFHLVRSLSHHSRQWIILAPQASIAPTTRFVRLIPLWWYTTQHYWLFQPTSHQSLDDQGNIHEVSLHGLFLDTARLGRVKSPSSPS